MTDLTRPRVSTSSRRASSTQLPRDPIAGERRVRVAQGPSVRKSRQTAQRRRLITPGTVILLVLIVLFGMYSTGHLPQLERYSNALVHSTQSHDDDIVAAVMGVWQYLAVILGTSFVGLVWLLILNGRRRKSSHTRKYGLRAS